MAAQVSVMVVPQAALTAKLKGNRIQHHGQLVKEEGRACYIEFLAALQA